VLEIVTPEEWERIKEGIEIVERLK